MEVVRTVPRLHALRAAWCALLERDANATPFQSPDWLLSWWAARGRGRPHVLTLHAGELLVGIVPLSLRAAGGLRRLELLGTGATDYLDAVLDPGSLPWAGGAIAHALVMARPEWDLCDFSQLRPGSLLRELEAPAGCRSELIDQEVCPVLPLDPVNNDLPASVPKRMRGHLRTSARRLAAAGTIQFEAAARDSLDEHLEALFRMHQGRWNRRWLPGAFATAAVRRMHREFARALLERGQLRLHGLRLDGVLHASLYCFRGRRTLYYYAAGFDPRIAHCSPGTLLLAHAIREAMHEGLAELDFLRGDERYKYAWGARDRRNVRRLIWHDSPRGRWARSMVELERAVEHRAKQLAARLVRLRG